MTEQQQTYEEYAQKGNYQQSDWSKRWQNNTTGWHLQRVNPILAQHYESYLKKDQDGKSTVFVPLCGKSIDMMWLAQQGNRVVGVEVVEQPCHDFFKEHNIQYDVKSLPNNVGQVMSSQVSELDILIYNCDYFALTQQVLGFALDSVWDRAAFVAINPSQRCQYAKHLHSLMASNARGLVVTLEYDINQRLRPGPPFCVPDDIFQTAFSPYADIIKVSSMVYADERASRFQNLTWLSESTFFLTFNQ